MFNLILTITFCVLFGVLPIYCFLARFDIKNHIRIILSLGFSTVLLAIINCIIVALGIETTVLKYFILILPYFLSLKQIKLLFNNKADYTLFTPMLFSVITGLLFCYVSFPDIFELYQKPHADVEFNLGLIQELKSHFLPHDPFWQNDNYLIYHFIGNLFMASLSNFIDLNILSIYNFGNVFIALNLFAIFGLMSKKKHLLSNLLISIIFLLYSTAEEWVLFKSFHSHLSTAASTFYWSLPVFFASIVLWDFIDARRKSIQFINQVIISFVLIFSVSFSKGSFIFPFLLLELICFIVFVMNERIYSFKQIAINIKTLLSFLLMPIFALFCAILLSSGSEGSSMFIGLEYRDLIFFESWSIFNPVLLLFTGPVLLFISTYILSKKKPLGLSYIIAALISFLMLFLITHEGFSDVYFGFNAILLLLVFYLKLDTSFKIGKVIIVSYFSFQILIFAFKPNVKLNNPKNIIENLIKLHTTDKILNSDSTFYKKIIELKEVGDLLDKKNVLLAVNKPINKDFKIPVYMGVSTWNSCNSYAHSTFNQYTAVREFLSNQEFYPTYATATPKTEDYTFAFSNFMKDFIPNVNKYENPQKRVEIYNQLVYGQLSKTETDKLLKETKITHIYVDKSKSSTVNNWIKSLDKIEANSFIIYLCN